jgi:outer membrane protein OmpA-like peptidoglycan-associated protein
MNSNKPVEVSLQVYGKLNNELVSYCFKDTLFVLEEQNTDSTLMAVDNGQNNLNPNTTLDTNNFITTDSILSIVNSNDVMVSSNIKPIYFDFDSAELTSKAKSELDNLASYLSKNPNAQLIITGHTDAMGSEEYNILLSKNRTNSAVTYLKTKGISNSKIIKTIGKGESEPAQPNTLNNGKDNYIGRKMNRRVEFTIIVSQ